MDLLTRAQIRDELRRMIGLTPPIDPQPGTGVPVPGAVEGDAPPGLPNPSNTVINNALSRVISRINMDLGFHIEPPVTVPLPATVTPFYGPQYIDLAGLPPFASAVNRVLAVSWQPAGDPIPTRLTATSLDNLDRNGYDYNRQPASTPTHYAVRGYSLAIMPATVLAASLLVTLGTGLLAPQDDTETLADMPADWQPYVLSELVVLIGEATPEDAEWQARIGVHATEVAMGRQLMYRNLIQRNVQDAPRLIADTSRRGYGTQRLRT